MDERPPGWVPVDQHVGQVPMSVTQDINPVNVPPPQDANKLASEIVRQNQPVINRFVSVQRQQIELGGLDVHSSVLPLKDMDVYYSYVQGLEKLHYHLSPQAEVPPEIPEPPTPEIPAPPTPEEPPVTSIPPPEPGPEVPEPPEPPEEAKPPEEKLPEEEKKEKGAPNFLEIDIPCFLAVEFGDGAGDP